MDEAGALDEALPQSHAGPSKIEIRPLYEMADLRRQSELVSH